MIMADLVHLLGAFSCIATDEYLDFMKSCVRLR